MNEWWGGFASGVAAMMLLNVVLNIAAWLVLGRLWRKRHNE